MCVAPPSTLTPLVLQRAPRCPHHKRHADARAGAPQTKLAVDPARYPAVRRDDSIVEALHGVEVADPYRALEDPDAPETQACERFIFRGRSGQGQGRVQSCCLLYERRWGRRASASSRCGPGAAHKPRSPLSPLTLHCCTLIPLSLTPSPPSAVVEAQNALTAEVLSQCSTRGAFKRLFTDLYK